MNVQGNVPRSELEARLARFRAVLTAEQPQWQLAAVFSRISQYYFTGTLQDGVLLIPRDGTARYFVRRSFERALAESAFPDILPMQSYRDAAAVYGATPDAIHVETEAVPLAMLQRFQKHFPARTVLACDLAMAKTRAVKSAYELACLERAGIIHRELLEEEVPRLLREGMSEAELGTEIYAQLVSRGHQGVIRFGMFQVEAMLGQIGFGDSSLYPTAFDGPGGCRGICAAAPVIGSTERTLRPGDLVFVDIGCGWQGYQTDKTMTYVFRGKLSDEAVAAHRRCVEIEQQAAAMLRPGAIPEEIYRTVMGSLSAEFKENFMGFGSRTVNFLGHGTGLHVDEYPVIAEKFKEPLLENMVIALEPKKGIPGIGLVGSENTYVVTPQGGRSLTGAHPGLLPVG